MEAFQALPTLLKTKIRNQEASPSHNSFAGDSTGDSGGEFTGESVHYTLELDSSSASDCESGVTGSSSSSSTATSGRRRRQLFDSRLATELSQEEKTYDVIRRRFVAGVGDKVEVVSIHRRNWSEFSAQARVQAFQVHSKALENKYGGPPNIKFGWYGGDMQKIMRILSHGFGLHDIQSNNNGAVFLSPEDSSSLSVENAVADEDGIMHLLLCRVLLGRSELVHPGSGQMHPSSDAFDSGVDGFESPKNYIVWSTNMNTHILPEYVVSFRLEPAKSSFGGNVVSSTIGNGIRMPTSPWISFPALISVLAKFLPPDAVSLINKYHKDYKESRISRPALIQEVRRIAGDKLLIAVIKSCKGTKELKMPFHLSRRRNANI